MADTDIVRLNDEQLVKDKAMIEDYLKKNKPSIVSHPPFPKDETTQKIVIRGE